MSCNDIRKHLLAAEEELRLAFVESLEQKNDENLSMLVECLNSVKDVLACTPIRKVDNISDYYRNKAEHDFKLGGDMDALDNVINFPTTNTGTLDDLITGDVSIDTTDLDNNVTFTPDPSAWGTNDVITFDDDSDDKPPTVS
tara:strand:- start:279 stop:704 length:426 start_codon:yes stop_codon:yes gene_type:complete